MPEQIVQEDLYELIVIANIEDALYVTGTMILEDKISVLENIWIRACAGNECKEYFPSSWKWKDIIHDVYEFIKKEAFEITEAFVITAKLCIIYKEILGKNHHHSIFVNDHDDGSDSRNDSKDNRRGSAKPLIHLKQLRNIIMEDFPEDATLSMAGVRRYSRIMPVAAEELLFAHRILSGLSRIWTEKQYRKSRDALEYLSRRKLSIALPDKSWPSPTPESSAEFIWFLWGAVLCYFQNNETVNKILYLFKHVSDNKKHKKQYRMGLLWNIFYIAGNIEGTPWTIDETKWIEYVYQNATDIWQQIRTTQEEIKQTEKALKKVYGHGSSVDDFDEIFGYIPRIGETYIAPENEVYKPSYVYTSAPLDNQEWNKREEGREREEKGIKIVGLKTSRIPSEAQASVYKLE